MNSTVRDVRPQRQVGSLFKAVRRTARYHLQDALGLRVKPVKLRLSLTNRCNSKCIMCSIWQFQDNHAPSLPGEITVDEIGRMLAVNHDFFADLSHVALTGGEPTLRRDFIDICRAFTDGLPGRSLSFNSNGFQSKTILSYVEEILKFRRKLAVNISLDGLGAAHNSVRGMNGNVYKGVLLTIAGLIELRKAHPGLKLEINCVMTNVNADQLLPVFEFCREHELEFNPIYITYGQLYQNRESDAVELNEQTRARVLEDLALIMRQDHSLLLHETMQLLKRRGRDFDCWAGRLMFLIEENCEVYPNGGCPYEYKLGNLRDFDFDFQKMLDAPQARGILHQAAKCRLCQIPCESMTTLRQAEALTGWRKTRELQLTVDS